MFDCSKVSRFAATATAEIPIPDSGEQLVNMLTTLTRPDQGPSRIFRRRFVPPNVQGRPSRGRVLQLFDRLRTEPPHLARRPHFILGFGRTASRPKPTTFI